MRFFTLFDESGAEFPITTKKVFFHEPGGLGFDEEASYFPVAYRHSLLTSTYSQGTISGNMIFVDDSDEEAGMTPYERGFEFTQFCTNKNLQLYYQPNGKESVGFYRDVRLSKFDKSEISELGILEVPVEFTCSTPWYQKVYAYRESQEIVEGLGWIWQNDTEGEGNSIWKTSRGYISWGQDTRNGYVTIDTTKLGRNILSSPCALIINGPATNPTWTHSVNGSVVANGRFAESVYVGAGEQLVISNATFPYQMSIRNISTGLTTRSVYQLRDFNTKGFIDLEPGTNLITVNTSDSRLPSITVEGHLYYGVV